MFKDKPPSSGLRSQRYLGLIAILFILLLGALVIYFNEEVRSLQQYGYIGAFIVSLLGSATLIVPVPALLVVLALGAVLKYPFLLGIIVGLAEPIGELTGYMAGRGGRAFFYGGLRRQFYERMSNWMRRRGGLSIVAISAFPNPFVDFIGAMAGSLNYPLKMFLFHCWVGKTIKGFMIAYIGAWGLKPLLKGLNILGFEGF